MKITHAVIAVTSKRFGVATIDRADRLEANRIICLVHGADHARRLADLFNGENAKGGAS